MRTHGQVISDALALSAISGLTGRGAIVATFAPVSAAGFVSTVAAPLISGTMVTLHGPFEPEVLRAQMMACPEAIVVLPATVEADIAEVDRFLGDFQGRIARDNWVEQAGHLAKGDEAGFAARFGSLGA